VTTALPSKPGLDGSKVLSIPSTWSATWFRELINNILKGADVRNAIAGPGITVSGNISSPYATIGLKSQGSGFGTPTGNSVIANYPGATATLAQANATIAELIVLLKQAGVISA
jgi:hypothetical protein